ncbi:MAG: MOSC domain-containing protein [Candidatus Firestonebacteria bacterium]
MEGKIFSINLSKSKGVSKLSVNEAKLVENFGFENDVHAGTDLRQVSLLSIESIRKQKECKKVKKTGMVLKPGDFAENITTEGMDLSKLKIGYELKIGENILLEVTKIGKECQRYCSIYYKTGDCIMPREGIFVKVVKGGIVKKGDKIHL